jgi:cytochrome c oxidase subunit II
VKSILKAGLLAVGLLLAPATIAQQVTPAVTANPAAAAPVATAAPVIAAPAASAPVAGIGQPVSGGLGIQTQVTPNGRSALWMHDALLMPIIVAISLFVLGLLFWASFRYRRKANPVASKTSHNTAIEIAWTLIPVLILVVISVPSISLLAAQYKPVGKDAITLKAIGNQWYWSYEYPDNGGFEVTANMLPDAEAKKRGEPRLLATDNRVVLPVGVQIRLLTTSNDVIHAWAIPAFWTQMDAVPGRINEASFTIEKPGVYYGQCNQICGARHGYMPITVEAVSKEKFALWVASKGGTMKGAKPAAAAVVIQPVTPSAPAAATKS